MCEKIREGKVLSPPSDGDIDEGHPTDWKPIKKTKKKKRSKSKICLTCGEDIKSEFDLTQLNMNMLDVSPVGEGLNRFEFKMPSGTMVHFKFLTSKEEKIISDEQDRIKKMTNSPFDSNVTTRLKHQLVSINGDDSPATINQFVDVMSVRDSRSFRKYFDEIEPDVLMKQDFNCPHCGHRGEVDIPITVGFFWPDSES